MASTYSVLQFRFILLKYNDIKILSVYICQKSVSSLFVKNLFVTQIIHTFIVAK